MTGTKARQSHKAAFQNYNHQFPDKSHTMQRCKGVLTENLGSHPAVPLNLGRYDNWELTHTQTQHRVPSIQNSIQKRVTLENEQQSQPQHPPYARSSGTPIRSYNLVFWIHFNLYDSQPPMWWRVPRPKAHWYMHQMIIIKGYLIDANNFWQKHKVNM